MTVFASINAESLQLRCADERDTVARLYRNWLAETLPRQVLEGGADDGAFDEYGHGWRDGRWSAFTLAKLVAARTWADDIGIDPATLDEPIRRAIAFLRRRQSPVGELDLGGAYSGIEAGFTLPGLVTAYRKLEEVAELASARAQLATFLRKAGEAVLGAEALTANHRWAAVCAPLAALNTLWPDERYVQKIDRYLADGIDCDSSGLWHIERCPNYSGVANHGIMVMADCLDRPGLLEHVVRNCRLTLYMQQPNGESDTSFSHRQSRNVPNVRSLNYPSLRRAAIRSGDGRIASLARAALREGNLGDMLYPLAFTIDAHPGELPSDEPLPEAFDLHLRSAQIARRRSGVTAITVSADSGNHFFDTVRDTWGGARRSDDWLHLHHGSVVIQSVQFAIGATHNIQPDWLEVTESGHYRLGGNRKGWRHTLHFRPDWPQLDVHWGLAHEIAIDHQDDALRLRLSAQAAKALIGSLRIFVRPGVIADGCGLDAAPLQIATTYDLTGGDDLHLTSGPDRVTLRGLPAATHRVRIEHPEPIPSAKSQSCSVLTLGLHMPAELDIQFLLRPRKSAVAPLRETLHNGRSR